MKTIGRSQFFSGKERKAPHISSLYHSQRRNDSLKWKDYCGIHTKRNEKMQILFIDKFYKNKRNLVLDIGETMHYNKDTEKPRKKFT